MVTGTLARDGRTYDNAETIRHGLRWQKIVGQDNSATLEVTFVARDARGQNTQKVTRQFKFRSFDSAPVLAALRRANYEINRVELNSAKDSTGQLNYWMNLHIQMTNFKTLYVVDGRAQSQPTIEQKRNWEFHPQVGSKIGGLYFANMNFQFFNEKGAGTISIELWKDRGGSRPRNLKPGSITGLLSIDDGWPQQIRVELPQGLPAKPGTIHLPFSAKLAPLPK